MSIREYMSRSQDVVYIKKLHTGPPADSSAMKSAIVPPNIYDKVRQMRRRLENEQWDVEDRRRRLAEMQEELKTQTKRHQIKRRRQLEREIAELGADIERISSGQKISEFLGRADPYIREFQRQQFCRPARPVEQSSKEMRVMEEYAVELEGAVPKFDIRSSDGCTHCNVQMQLYTTLSMLVCPRCGCTRAFLDATANLLAFSDDSYEYGSFSYKRINHFSEWLASVQAKENLEVPREILTDVMQRLYDERITAVENITVHKVRDILKKLRLRKYYEHVQLITCKITGRKPPCMTLEMEERIKACFQAASQSFQRHCPPNRKNFISYSLVIYKLCELLGYREFMPYFTLLKGRDKLTKMDEIWRLICADLDWTFIPCVP